MKLTQREHTDNVLKEFIQRIKKDSDMQGLSDSAQEELWNRIDYQNKSHDRRFVRLLIWSGSIAASICILVVAWYMFSPVQPATVDYASVMQNFTPVDETSGNVQLVLSNNQKITIEGQETHVDYEEGWVNINKNEQMEVKEDMAGEQTAYNQLVVPAGKRSTLTFSDGTRVWINASSKLVYPVNFEKNKREIFVEGEIYIEVTPDSKRPFIVRANSLDVKVLGTNFNVSAYADQPDLQVVLVSGAVEIQQDGVSKEILKPNQMISYNKEMQDFSISMVDVSDYIVWKEGYYPFYRQGLGTVLTKLSNYYGVQFQWNEKVGELSCSGKLDLKEDLLEVLSVLEKAAPIEIQKTSEREYTVIVKP